MKNANTFNFVMANPHVDDKSYEKYDPENFLSVH